MLDSDEDMKARIRDALTRRFSADVARAARLEKMGGHASLRIYWRVHMPSGSDSPRWKLRDITGETTLVAMVLAPDYEPARSAEGPEDERLETDELPFVDVQRYLAGLGIPVPAIEHIDRESDVLLLEDLGDRTFEDFCLSITEEYDPADRSELAGLYRQGLDLLVSIQKAFLDSRETEGEAITDTCICWRREFDRDTLRWELDHYLEWGIEERVGPHVLDDDVRGDLDRLFDRLVDQLLRLDQLVVLRDFQSRNLMCKESDDRDSNWVVIDFQDALVGPYVYDVVALLRDSYIELQPDLVSELLEHYVEVGRDAGLPWCDDAARVRRAFHLQTVQRKLKDSGRFIFIDRQKNNPDFLEYYDPSMRYVDHALDQLDGWDELRNILHRLDPAL